MGKDKARKPVAVCTICGVYTFNSELINENCRTIYKEKRCIGCYGSAGAPNDWKECPTCMNTGRKGSNECDACQGSGWIYIREEFWDPLE